MQNVSYLSLFFHVYTIISLFGDAKRDQNVRGMHNRLFWIIS